MDMLSQTRTAEDAREQAAALLQIRIPAPLVRPSIETLGMTSAQSAISAEATRAQVRWLDAPADVMEGES